jgi:hypothetical protein
VEAVSLVYYKAYQPSRIPKLNRGDQAKLEGIIYRRMPGLFKPHYLHGFVSDPQKWEGTAPRPDQRRLAVSDTTNCNLVLYGRQTGSGKTCAALERIVRGEPKLLGYDYANGPQFSDEDAWPLWISGVTFAARCSRMAADNRLEDFLDNMCAPGWLLLDDADKRGASDGSLSATVQQAWLALIERRTNESNGDAGTIITLNSDGPTFAAKFGDNYREYVMRRLATRFEAIDFDPPRLEGIKFTDDANQL